MVSEVREIGKKDDRINNLYLKGFDQIENMFSIKSLRMSGHKRKLIFESSAVDLLYTLSVHLEGLDIENSLYELEKSKKDLNKWKEDLSNLEKEILESEIESKVKDLLIKQIISLKCSINYYWIHGAQGIRDELHHLVVSLAGIERHDKSEENQSVYALITQTLKKINSALELPHELSSFMPHITNLIT